VQISGDRCGLTPSSSTPRRTHRFGRSNTIANWKTSSRLQSELAQTIAAQLKATLSTGEKAEIWRQPTQDLQAYDLYLRARAALRGEGAIFRTRIGT